MTAFQGQSHWELVYAGDPVSGAPITGLLFSAVSVSYLYGGATVFVPKTLLASDWTEIGGGYYFLQFKAADLTQLGSLAFVVTNAAIKPIYHSFDVDPAPIGLLAQPPLCVITGNVVDLAGRSFSDQNQSLAISFRIATVPQQVGGTSLISSRLITTTTDAYGNFSVALLQGALVFVEVDPLGLKQRFTVPTNQSTATLLSLLPPIP